MTLLLAAACLVAASAVIGLGHFPLATWVWLVILSAVAGTALVALAVWWGDRAGARLGTDRGADRRFASIVFGTAILARLLLIPADHYLSDDAFRYHWDGKVLANGINPYRHAPADDAVQHLATDEIDALINHPDVVTVYPPYAELLFAAGHLLTPGHLLGFQLLALLSELAAWLVLLVAATRARLPRVNLLLAAWLPLVIFESYLPGHTEALALPFVALFFLSVTGGRAYRAGLALGLACLVKPVALLFVPAAVRELGVVRSLRMAPGLLAVVGALYAPFLGAGENLTSSMFLMARKWSFNASLANLLEAIVPEPALRPLLLALLGAGVVVATFAGRDLVTRALGALVALVVVTPTLYPWYLIWAVPLVVLRPHPALIALMGLAPLTHVAVIDLYTKGVWDPPAWPSVVEYAGFYALLAWSGVRAVTSRRRLRRSPSG